MAPFPKIATALIALLCCSCSVIKGGPDETVVYTICSDYYFESWGFDNLVHDVLKDVVDGTQDDPSYSCYASNDQIIYSEVFGHGACNGILTQDDCYTCMRRAKDLILDSCHLHIGAQLQLQDCRIRYEKYYFYEG